MKKVIKEREGFWSPPEPGDPEQVLRKHTIIELGGYPFQLAEDTKVYGGWDLSKLYDKDNSDLKNQM